MRVRAALGVETLGRGDRIVLEIGALARQPRSATAGDAAAARTTLREVVFDVEAWRENGCDEGSGAP